MLFLIVIVGKLSAVLTLCGQFVRVNGGEPATDNLEQLKHLVPQPGAAFKSA
jgi:hypothetical protein